jgi:HAD superfamily hydrolase (TIGR01509 family)
MVPKLTAILWDHDGVLVDTERLFFRATKDILARAGVDLMVEDYRQLLLIEGRGAWHLARERGVAQEEIDKLRAARDDLYRDMLASGDVLIAGALVLLERLKPRYRMAVVTSSQRSHFDAIHGRTRLRELVEFVLTREDYANCKPHPEPYLRALQRLALPSAECVVIEDSERGLRSAQAAGLRCWVVRSELTAGFAFDAAEQCFSCLAGLGEVLLA